MNDEMVEFSSPDKAAALFVDAAASIKHGS